MIALPDNGRAFLYYLVISTRSAYIWHCRLITAFKTSSPFFGIDRRCRICIGLLLIINRMAGNFNVPFTVLERALKVVKK